MSDNVLSRGFVSLIHVFDEKEYCNSGCTVIACIKHIIRVYRCSELTDIFFLFTILNGSLCIHVLGPIVTRPVCFLY
jgi:hypothetical protein